MIRKIIAGQRDKLKWFVYMFSVRFSFYIYPSLCFIPPFAFFTVCCCLLLLFIAVLSVALMVDK